MCANPRDVCANFISFFSCSKAADHRHISYLETLPVEILEKIIYLLNYEQISKLRSVNCNLNLICSRYLNKAFFKIKEEVESRIFLLYEDLNVDGKFITEKLIEYYREDKFSQRQHFQPTILKVLFANKLLLVLNVISHRIFQYMFYGKIENFVFIYGNCVDWALEMFNFLTKKHRVELLDTWNLRPPLKATRHVERMIAFYKNKTRLTGMELERYMEMKAKPAFQEHYESRVYPIVSRVEVFFYATFTANSILKPEVYRFDKIDVKNLYNANDEDVVA